MSRLRKTIPFEDVEFAGAEDSEEEEDDEADSNTEEQAGETNLPE